MKIHTFVLFFGGFGLRPHTPSKNLTFGGGSGDFSTLGILPRLRTEYLCFFGEFGGGFWAPLGDRRETGPIARGAAPG